MKINYSNIIHTVVKRPITDSCWMPIWFTLSHGCTKTVKFRLHEHLYNL